MTDNNSHNNNNNREADGGKGGVEVDQDLVEVEVNQEEKTTKMWQKR